MHFSLNVKQIGSVRCSLIWIHHLDNGQSIMRPQHWIRVFLKINWRSVPTVSIHQSELSLIIPYTYDCIRNYIGWFRSRSITLRRIRVRLVPIEINMCSSIVFLEGQICELSDNDTLHEAAFKLYTNTRAADGWVLMSRMYVPGKLIYEVCHLLLHIFTVLNICKTIYFSMSELNTFYYFLYISHKHVVCLGG